MKLGRTFSTSTHPTFLNQTKPRTPPRRVGFTIVELLVVIGIIIILMSMLMPALSVVRESARSRDCQNSLRQLGSIYHKTEMNVRGRLRPARLREFFATYLEDKDDVWQCPDVDPGKVSYGFHNRMHRMFDEDTYKVLALDYNKDAVVRPDGEETRVSEVDVVGPPGPKDNWAEMVGARHRGYVNILFYAGNVESRDPDAIDPRICWIHERHWRPELELKLIRSPALGETNCDAPDPPDSSGVTTNPPPPQSTTGETGPPPIPDCIIDPKIVDNNHDGFTPLQTWEYKALPSNPGYNTGIHVGNTAATVPKEAVWTFFGLPRAEYQVSITWTANDKRATKAPFQIFDGAEQPVGDPIEINQTSPPSADVEILDEQDTSIPFQHLGSPVLIENGALTLKVTTDGAGGEVLCADAVRVACEGDTSGGTTGDGNTTGNEGPGDGLPELIAHYEFEDFEDVGLDSSEEMNDGYPIGTIQQDCDGTGVLKFDGDQDHFEVPRTAKFGGAFTMAVWVYMDELRNNSRVIDFGNGPIDNIIVQHSSGGQLLFKIRNGSSEQSLAANSFFTAKQWIHVAVTVSESGEMKVFKNGVRVAQKTGIAPPVKDRTQQYVGRSNGSEPLFIGMMDDLRLYGIELEAGDISSLTSGGPTCEGGDSDVEVLLDFNDLDDPYLDTGEGPGNYDGFGASATVKECSGGDHHIELEENQKVEFPYMGFSGNHAVTAMAWVRFWGVTVDDSQATISGSFKSKIDAGYGNTYHIGKGDGPGSVTWRFDNLPSGNYQVEATWVKDANLNTTVTYSFGQSAFVDQKTGPSQNPYVAASYSKGRPFRQLSTSALPVTGGSVEVQITRNGSGRQVADAVRLAKWSGPPPTTWNPKKMIIFGLGEAGREFSFGLNGTKLQMTVGSTILESADVDGLHDGWVHVAAVFDPSNKTMKLYFDGNEVATQTIASANFKDRNYILGAFKSGDGFVGEIDNFRVFGRALSGGDVTSEKGDDAKRFTM